MSIDAIVNAMETTDLSEILKLISKRFSIHGGGSFDEMYLAVKFSVEPDRFLMNIPTQRQDYDEYPVLSITDHIETEYEWEELCIGVLEKVSIIRDEVKWRSEDDTEYEVTQDVGVKFYFNDFEALIMSVDGIAGLLKCKVHSKVDVPSSQEDVLSYWIMKFDEHELVSWKRSEVSVA